MSKGFVEESSPGLAWFPPLVKKKNACTAVSRGKSESVGKGCLPFANLILQRAAQKMLQ